MSKKKPFYSKRRLKKMGLVIVETQDNILFYAQSLNGNICQASNIVKVLKNANKHIAVRIDSMASSCASWKNRPFN